LIEAADTGKLLQRLNLVDIRPSAKLHGVQFRFPFLSFYILLCRVIFFFNSMVSAEFGSIVRFCAIV